MPELPEVETTVQGLKRLIEKQTIESAQFHREAIRYSLDNTWLAAMSQQPIEHISRRAKLIIMRLGRGVLLWHLGMTGSLRVCASDELRRQHDHVELSLSSGKILRFHDPRRFGYLKWFDHDKTLQQHIAHYGIEPLTDTFNADYLYRLSRHKIQSVKNFIMNQTIVVGVGNIYACEALFMAKIRPQTPCGRIGKIRYQRLVEALKSVLTQAIAQGGTTLKDFENADAKPGYFKQALAVYGRQHQPCFYCGRPIKNIRLGGRSSFYCASCQRE